MPVRTKLLRSQRRFSPPSLDFLDMIFSERSRDKTCLSAYKMVILQVQQTCWCRMVILIRVLLIYFHWIHPRVETSVPLLPLMEDIRLTSWYVVYPIVYKVFIPSQEVGDGISEPSTVPTSHRTFRKGGIVVREDVDLKSTELSRLASGRGRKSNGADVVVGRREPGKVLTRIYTDDISCL